MTDREERLLAIERMNDSIRRLTESKKTIENRIGAVQRSNRTMIGSQNALTVMQDLVAEGARTHVELDELHKRRDRARETFNRDYPE